MDIPPERQCILRSGFTLVELLVAIVVVIAIAAVSFGAAQRTMERTDTLRCAAKMKSLASATILYAQEHEGRFPRSFHSAGAHREPGWAVSIAPYLGVTESEIEHSWDSVFNNHFRSP
jgi:Tfp pilus assembly protein PilV